MSFTELNLSSIIIHIDMDCFYCQVEQKRLGIPPTQPLAVQQWQKLIAVNYAARAQGVLRHDTAIEAKKKCKDLRLVHVLTYAEGETGSQYHENPSPLTHKVSLEAYRRESSKIFEVLQRYSPCERASVDEAYLDLTEFVEERLGRDKPRQPISLDWEGLGIVVGGCEEKEWTYDDLRLHMAAIITKEIREDVFKTAGYTCSGGIAHNKMLAKLASGSNKPNKQTIIPFSATKSLLEKLPLEKVKQMGGKRGQAIIEKLEVQYVGDLLKYSLAQLQNNFGEKNGIWIWNMCRGNLVEKIVPRSKTKTMGADKQFPPVSDFEEIKKWINVLTAELVTRLFEEYEETHRWPRTLTLHSAVGTTHKNKSCQMSTSKNRDYIFQEIQKNALQLFLSIEERYPCRSLSLHLSNFSEDGTSSNSSILNFFGKAIASLPPISDQIPNDEDEGSDTAEEKKRPVVNTIEKLFQMQKDKSDNPQNVASENSSSLTVTPNMKNGKTSETSSSSSQKKTSPFTTTPLKTSCNLPEPGPMKKTPDSEGSTSIKKTNNASSNDSFLDEDSFFNMDSSLNPIIVDGLSPEERKQSLHRFFTSKKEVVKEGKFQCEFCKEWVELQKRPEHTDYHFALTLQKAQQAEEEERKALEKMKNVPSLLKRKSQSASSNTLDNFLKKKMKGSQD